MASDATAAVEFARLGESDLPRALEIYNHYVRTSTATFQITPADEAGMRDILFSADPRHASWTIRRDGAVLGYLIVGRHKAREAYATSAEVSIYLAPDATGRGLGRAAMAKAEEHARAAGFHALVASITGTNEASIALARACGWEQCARYREIGRKFDQWLDVVCFQKLL